MSWPPMMSKWQALIRSGILASCIDADIQHWFNVMFVIQLCYIAFCVITCR
jgi:hypothetical protein